MRNLSQNFKQNILTELKDLIDQTVKIKKALLNTVGPEEYVREVPENIQEEIETWKFRTLSFLKKILKDSDKRIMEFEAIFFPEKEDPRKIFWPKYYNLRGVYVRIHLDRVLGILNSIENEIKKGLFEGLEDLISGDIFDSVLESAKYLLGRQHKDAAAVYGRVVLEQTLKRLCDKQNPPITYSSHTKISKLNDELKKVRCLSTPEWRRNRFGLDIGNAAAHGKFTNYTSDDVNKFLSDLEGFISKKL